MPAAKPTRLIGGLVTTPMEAGPGDFASCINLMDEHGLLRKRGGMKILESYGNWVSSGFYAGWRTTAAEPASVATAATSPSSGYTTVYVGGDNPFYQFHIYGNAAQDVSATWADILGEYKRLVDLTVEYWNGSAWTAVASSSAPDGSGAADLFTPQRDSGNASFVIAPYCAQFEDATSGSSAVGFQIRGRIKPPSDWTAKTIGGQSKKWLRIRCLFTDQTSATVVAGSSRFTTAEHPILCLLPFQDRRGTPHLFVVYRYSDNTLKYVLDGTTLTASDSLEPDGTSVMFSDNTRVWAYYDSSTDRIIGFVEGHTWFFSPASNNGEIYNLAADDVGTATPYQSVIGGLRSAIPDGNIACTHDDRIFTANGQAVVYSSPGPYKDLWPNDNEIFVADDRGNVTAMVSVGGVLGLFKRDSIWVCQSDGSDDGYVAYRLPGNVGCVAPRSLAVAGDVAYFLAEDGVYRFDGQAVQKLSKRIDGFFSAGWSSCPERAIGVWNPVLNQYRLFYPGPNDNPWVCSYALYACQSEEGGMTFWPQGPKDKDFDEGFNATAVVRDDSRALPRVLLGDRYGCVWVMDTGGWDGAYPVAADGVTHRVNLGTAQKYMLRWVTPVSPAESNNTWTLSVWADGNESAAQTVTPYLSGDMSANGFFGGSGVTTHAANTTFTSNFERASGPSQSFEVLGRFIQMRMTDVRETPWALDALEIEATPFARRG